MGEMSSVLVPVIPHNLIVVIDDCLPVLQEDFVDLSVVGLVTVSREFFAIFIGHVAWSVVVSKIIKVRTKMLDAINKPSPFDTLFDVIGHLMNLF